MSIWDRARNLASNALARSRKIAAEADRRRKKAAIDRAKKAKQNRDARKRANDKLRAQARAVSDRIKAAAQARARAAAQARARAAAQARAERERIAKANFARVQQTYASARSVITPVISQTVDRATQSTSRSNIAAISQAASDRAKNLNAALMNLSLMSVAGPGVAAQSAKQVDAKVAQAEASYATLFPSEATIPRTALQIANERNITIAKGKLELAKQQPDTSRTKEIDLTAAAEKYLNLLKTSAILASPSITKTRLAGRALYNYLATLRESQQPQTPFFGGGSTRGAGFGGSFGVDDGVTSKQPLQTGILGDPALLHGPAVSKAIIEQLNYSPCDTPGEFLRCKSDPNIAQAICQKDYRVGSDGSLRFIPTDNTCPPIPAVIPQQRPGIPSFTLLAQPGEDVDLCNIAGATKTCPTDPSIILSRCQIDNTRAPIGLLRWVETGSKCPSGLPPIFPPITGLPSIGSQCNAVGDQSSVTCPDGKSVTTLICGQDPTTRNLRWEPTGRACQAATPVACTVGETKTAKGLDGKDIVTHTCVLDTITSNTYWAPTPPQQGKSIRILADGNLKAFVGMKVTITAGVMCGGVPSNGELAILLIDGKEIARGTTSGGFVSFNWVATIDKSRSQKVEVYVPESTTCGQFGAARDTRIITVSRKVPKIEERLAAERAQYEAQVAALLAERARITQSSIPAQPAQPVYIPPPVIVPPVITDQPPLPDQPPVEKVPGIIYIPDIPKPPKSIAVIDISIDGKFLGSPPISHSVVPGKHQIRADAQNLTSIQRTITVAEGETATIIDMRFV